VHYPRAVPESVEVLIVAQTIPAYAHPGDAGADLTASEAAELPPGGRATIGTGVAIALPDGFVAFVVPRSGLAARHGITVVNSPGTVDAGYRGEIRVTLLNTDSSVPYSVAVGDRIAQLVIMPVSRARFVAVEHLPGSHRGEAGFGSTGYTDSVGVSGSVGSEQLFTAPLGELS
jgi:dUTP pyrophosphatase